jgi:RNA polymerase sigma-70 factor (ECF subfamily)
VTAPTVFRQQLLTTIPRLRRYARSLVFEPSAADDLVQTVLERSLSHWQQFDQRRDILVWVLGIAHNAHMDGRRRQAPQPNLDPHSQEGEHCTPPAGGHDPAMRLDLMAALAQLCVEQREPLLLVSVEQLTYAECAEVLRIPVGTVMSRVSRARAALRALLEGPQQVPAATRGLRRVV